jgi:outer membrane immunogenic protein
MSKTIFAGAIAVLALVTSAAAADLTPYAAPARAYSWVGPYVGVNLGYQWADVSHNGASPSGVAGGVQAGYNFQSGPLVFGAETDLQASGADDRFAGWKFSNPWFGTLRVRGGFAMNNILLYGTAGLAYGTLTARNVVTGVSESHTSAGWAGGLGMEVALADRWTAKAEYLYVDLNDSSYVLDGTSHGLQSNMLRFGVNYRF